MLRERNLGWFRRYISRYIFRDDDASFVSADGFYALITLEIG